MTPENRRRIVSAVILLLAVGLVALALLRPRPEDAPLEDAPAPEPTTTASVADAAGSDAGAAAPEATMSETSEPEATTPETTPASTDTEATSNTPEPTPQQDKPEEAPTDAPSDAEDSKDAPATGSTLVARAPGGATASPTSLGGLDPTKHRFQISFSESSAGIEKVVFSDFWTEASFARAAARHQSSGGETPMPPEDERYTCLLYTSPSPRD